MTEMRFSSLYIYRGPVTGRVPDRRRRQENPVFSPRLGPVRDLRLDRFPGRRWYPYHGYPRPLRLPVTAKAVAPPLPVPRRRLIPRVVFSLLPGFLYPFFFGWAAYLYPRLALTGSAVRIPRATTFFPQLLIAVLAAASVAALQTVFALVFLRKGKPARPGAGFRWGEAVAAGGLLAPGIYGVLRGFQYRTGELFFLPAFAIGTAAFFWLLISASTLFGRRRRRSDDTPGPIRTADTRFRKPVLYPTELQGRNERVITT